MKHNYQVCLDCCTKLDLRFNGFIESKCHRKYCDVCGYSSGNDLSMLRKEEVDAAITEYNDAQEEN